jgi:hypothetical protein
MGGIANSPKCSSRWKNKSDPPPPPTSSGVMEVVHITIGLASASQALADTTAKLDADASVMDRSTCRIKWIRGL